MFKSHGPALSTSALWCIVQTRNSSTRSPVSPSQMVPPSPSIRRTLSDAATVTCGLFAFSAVISAGEFLASSPFFVSPPSKQAICGRRRSTASACEGAEKHENFSAQSQGQKHGLKLRKGDYVVFTDQIVSSGTDFHAVKHTFFHGEIQIVADEIFCLSNSITVSAKMQPAVNGNTCPLCHL